MTDETVHPDQAVNSLLDDIEQLMGTTRRLNKQREQWKNRAQSAIIQQDQDRERIDQLRSQQMQYVETLGRLEEILKAIREKTQS